MEYIFTVDLTDDYVDNCDNLEIQEDELNILYLEDNCRISLNPKKSFAKILESKENYSFIILEIQKEIELSKDEIEEYKAEIQEFCQKMLNGTKEGFYNQFKTIYINGDNETIIEYIKNNPQIKNYNIVKSSSYSLSDEGLIQARSDYETINRATGCNISIVIEGNEEPTKIEDFQKVLDIINSIVIKIKKMNLSPFEIIIFVYDLIREREYQEENKSEYHSKSRDITSVLLGDKIVCAGFVNLFNTILKKLGIECIPFRLTSTIKGHDNHVQSLVLIKDLKYSIDGLYLFDPTGECKDRDNSYLSSYFHFAKTSKEMRILYDRENLEPYYPFLNKNKINCLNSILPNTISIVEIGMLELIKGLNPILKLLKNSRMELTKEYPKEKLIGTYNAIYDACNKIIPIDTFIQAFTTVRALEYYLNPEKFPFDKNTIEEATFTNSFYKIPISVEEQNILRILGVKISSVKRGRTNEFVDRIIDEKSILMIKLTRNLRNRLNNH